MIGVNVDITGRRQAEAELQEQRRQVAHLGRVAVVGELSIALAHELRQPLAAILANAKAGTRLLAQDPPNLGQRSATSSPTSPPTTRARRMSSRGCGRCCATTRSRGSRLDVNDSCAKRS